MQNWITINSSKPLSEATLVLILFSFCALWIFNMPLIRTNIFNALQIFVYLLQIIYFIFFYSEKYFFSIANCDIPM